MYSPPLAYDNETWLAQLWLLKSNHIAKLSLRKDLGLFSFCK